MQFRPGKSFKFQNSGDCGVGDWVIIKDIQTSGSLKIARIIEILQILGSSAELENRPNFILSSIHTISNISRTYGMPELSETGLHALVDFEVTINI